jgi:long-chain acyl-CoA synthetase
VLDRLVRNSVRARFGGRLKAFVSGGAPLNVDIGLFFHALGVPVLQGYGQTEAAPFVACNRPGRVRMDTVGPALLGVELRIAEDGEILVRGGNVMPGYWQDPAATAQVLKDGWLHTGDVGSLDAEERLAITDRKKDIIVNSGGDNIAPAKVEGVLCLQPEIQQAMVFGDKRPYLVAVVVPDETIAASEDCREQVAAAIARLNKTLSQPEQVRSFILAEPFSTANGMMTPTLKIRRHKIREAYAAQVDALYPAKRQQA